MAPLQTEEFQHPSQVSRYIQMTQWPLFCLELKWRSWR